MRVGLGCVQLGSASSTASWRDQVAVVRQAVDAGVRLFDTADSYGSGSSERVLGRALKHRRDDVVIATKGGYTFRPRSTFEQRGRQVALDVHRRIEARRRGVGGAGTSPSVPGSASYDAQDFAPARITQALDASLRRLGTDYIDVYQFHGPRDLQPEALATLVEAREQGKIRAIGVGCETIESALQWCAVDDIDTLQIPFGVLDPRGVDDVMAQCNRARVATGVPELWARAVLGGGVLAAAIDAGQSDTDHPKHALVDALLTIARDAGMELDELAVRWVRSHDAVSTMLVGSTRVDHIRRNHALAQMPALPGELCKRIAGTLAALDPSGGDAA